MHRDHAHPFTAGDFRVEWLDEVGSTNAELVDRLRRTPGLQAGLVLAARHQTAGRGRAQRTWTAPPGVNLTFSLLLRSEREPVHLVSLPMAAALTIADVLAGYGVAARLKWPNDVQVRGRKIAGLLLDVPAGGAAVLGVGLNVNMTADDAARIDQPATSLRIETGGAAVLEDVLGAFLGAFSRRYADWLAGGFEALRADWVRLAEPAGASGRRGEIAGYGPHGELLIRRPDGGVEACWITD